MTEQIETMELEDSVKLQSAHSDKVETQTIDNRGAHKKRKHDDNAEFMKGFAQGNYGPDYERRKAENHREINMRVIKPEDLITGETWKKTPEEREAVQIAKAKHNALLRAHGINPKKQMNVLPGDEIVIVKAAQKQTTKKVVKK